MLLDAVHYGGFFGRQLLRQSGRWAAAYFCATWSKSIWHNELPCAWAAMTKSISRCSASLDSSSVAMFAASSNSSAEHRTPASQSSPSHASLHSPPRRAARGESPSGRRSQDPPQSHTAGEAVQTERPTPPCRSHG
ncbi:uncharacterized protein Tco025E_04226 [Trypanosoma conorhini]|uniref:Uncharacterized protein n=1 Tax=Trypanosoma conorhini TaxID=83891 RepID=A0A3R7P8M5_9TRYP|nr:uncharacterized protein Tco025E_04226 [Trypanosoma conorhini]RNF19291.1 hypothetical protein Tco025E_04226 [Trypanosoma conorhini]